MCRGGVTKVVGQAVVLIVRLDAWDLTMEGHISPDTFSGKAKLTN
jgi:hypothetical protein